MRRLRRRFARQAIVPKNADKTMAMTPGIDA
jgi:hypothetical protein